MNRSCGHAPSLPMLRVVFLGAAEPLLKKCFTSKNQSIQSYTPFALSFLLKCGLLFCGSWVINANPPERKSWVLWPLYGPVFRHGFRHKAAITLLLMFYFYKCGVGVISPLIICCNLIKIWLFKEASLLAGWKAFWISIDSLTGAFKLVSILTEHFLFLLFYELIILNH